MAVGPSLAAPARRQRVEPLADVDWTARRVTVLGLGRHGGGVAAARYLAVRGARVTISDSADAGVLADSLAQLADLAIEAVHLDGHAWADLQTEFVVVNPAIRPDHSALRTAREAGARLISETELFLTACPAKVVGVTGTNGKSTTCSMLHAMLATDGRRAWLGGNIGRSLLGDLESMTADDWVVLELSSFQLAHLSATARMPELAVITNCSANHLDWHGSYADYVAAKLRLVADSSAVTVLNQLDGEVAGWSAHATGRIFPSWPLKSLPMLAIAGEHNRQNAACAAAAGQWAGISLQTIISTLEAFAGLPHRIELVAEIDGRRFYNDSKATSPAAAAAALAAIDGPLWLLAGGDAKGADFHALGRAVAARVAGAAVFGAARHELQAAIQAAGGDCPAVVREDLSAALAWCWRRSRPGDAIVLSPACASHDQFRDFQERGETFRALVGRLASRDKQ
ncbi:MAG: UDP-N-acetylmuramoyl-L-alanine--D-glutamate ligase [Pirellulales bacterium]